MDTFELWLDNSWQKNMHDPYEIMAIKRLSVSARNARPIIKNLTITRNLFTA